MSAENNSLPEETIPPYRWRSGDVHTIEREHYLKKHRQANGITEEPTPDNLSGLCISGGGVRSATLGLGMLQAFIKGKKLKYFDYLSTVSGGGYIGACLSSLMSEEPKRRDKIWNNSPRTPIENHNTKFDVSQIGLEEHNALFTRAPYEYPNIEDGKLTTKHQLIHLREHGEYLTPHKSIKDWDVHRLLGALFGGIVTNVSTFFLFLTVVVLLHHVMLAWMSGDQFIETLQRPTAKVNQYLLEQHDRAVAHFEHSPFHADKTPPSFDYSALYTPLDQVYKGNAWQKLSTAAQLKAWAIYSFEPQLALVLIGLKDQWKIPLAFGLLGFLFAGLFIFWSRRLPFIIAKQEQEEQNYQGKAPNNKTYRRKGEENMLDLVGRRIIRWYYHIGLWGIPLLAYVVTAYLNAHSENFNYFVMLALPLCYALGLFLGLHAMIFLYFINNGTERVSGWLYRSFYTGMQGGAFLMVIITFLFPLAIMMLFGDHGLAIKLSLSFLPVLVAYFFTMQSLGGRAGTDGFIKTLIRRLQMPLLNLSIFLFVGLAFAWISQGLFTLEQHLLNNWGPEIAVCNNWNRTDVVITLFFIALTLLLIMGFTVNANDVSLHYFYRDRLSEAFLRTSGRLKIKTAHQTDEQEYNLLRINLRNHVDLPLHALGEGNFRAPYHLIVTALNLQGSHELSAKTLRSEHFIFSKYFIGSRSTGYANTHVYNFGSTKLSTAMAISGAALSSGMGPLSFAASNFYMTLLNLRTGYWIDNPKYFIAYKKQELRAKSSGTKRASSPLKNKIQALFSRDNLQLKWLKISHRYPFWLHYIWRELTGNLGADTRKVNVSDGGHTGDNLGLLPLLQRRCSTIVVADFEADGSYSFESFGQAVRLAKSIYNVDISIDLSKLMPQKTASGDFFSPSSVAEGIVTYNLEEDITNKNGKKEVRFYQKTGQIIYLKSSVNLLKAAAEEYDENAAPPPIAEPAPVMVLNYFKKNPKFPHQASSDQYFDDAQFEAYRMLGEHIGKQAAPLIKFGDLRAV